MQPNRDTIINKVEKYLVVIFLSLAVVCLLVIVIAYIIAFIPKLKVNEWDLLAFIGSIIVAVITVMGIRVPIINQKNEQQMLRFERELKQLHVIIKETSFIQEAKEFELIDFESDSVDDIGTIRAKAGYLEEFIEVIEKSMPSLIESLDLRFFQDFDAEFTKLTSAFLFYFSNLNDYLNYWSKIPDSKTKMENYLNRAENLHVQLVEYRDEITTKYYDLKNKPVFFKQ